MQFFAATRNSVSRSLRHYICLRMQFRGGFLQFKTLPPDAAMVPVAASRTLH